LGLKGWPSKGQKNVEKGYNYGKGLKRPKKSYKLRELPKTLSKKESTGREGRLTTAGGGEKTGEANIISQEDGTAQGKQSPSKRERRTEKRRGNGESRVFNKASNTYSPDGPSLRGRKQEKK